jgi:UDP-2,3-diacylglucosamine pyrophosphatase LpxH
MVLSDLHYHDAELGTSGPAFERYLNKDRKLLAESSEILGSAVDAISEAPADFVLVCGDLTKDGELINHQKVAENLRRIEESGKKVFVVPGNHDILNYEAFRYTEDKTEPVDHITAEDFARIYAEFGYAEAVDRDPASLSYVCEPVPGLWLLALDGCMYGRNKPGHESTVDGALSVKTRDWMLKIMDQAAREEKPVIAMIHHGILEHFPGQAKYFRPYLLKNRKPIARDLIGQNVKVVFTGHFHAQDIVREGSGSQDPLYDIETGSLVTYPAAYREVVIDADQKMHIGTKYITAIGSWPVGFAEHVREFTRQGLMKIALDQMRGYGVNTYNAPLLAAQVADILIANYHGDELRLDRPVDISRIGCLGGILTSVLDDGLKGLTRDREPPDNNLIIDLTRGSWTLPGKEP